MSLVVYVAIDKFKAESGAAVREQNATEITLSDIAKWQPNTGEAGTAENQLLVIGTFSEEALALLKNWLKKDTASECIIAWPQPDAWLAASLANGVAGEEALNDWLAQAKRLLALFRSARRQVTLAGYLPGCELKVVKAPLLDRCENAIYQLAAAYISSQSQALKDTHAYLVASSQECPIEESCETQVTQAALSEYHARQTESEEGRRNARALQEADATQERQQQHIARLKGELNSARDEHTLLLQQLQSAQQIVAERTDEHALLLQQLQSTQQALAERTDEYVRLLEQLQNAQQVVAERTNELRSQREQTNQFTQRLQELEQQLQVLKKENESLKRAFETQRKEQGVTQQHNQTLKKENKALKQAFETQCKEQSVTQQHNQALKKENKALKQAFETQRKEQGVTQQHNQVLKKENEVHKQAFEEQQKEKDINQRNLVIAQRENSQLLGTLQQVQQAYETLYIKHQTQYEQLSKRKSELNALRTESEQCIHCLECLVQWLRVHAQRHVAVAYRESRSYKKALLKQVAMLEASPLFDADWYCAQYPDVAQANIKPAEHFIKFGAIDGRHPGPLFSTEFYLTHHEDVAASGQHPLLHYLRYGIDEEREIQPPQYQLPALQTIAKGANA